MKITIIGAGAMGSLFGSYLFAGGHEVTLVSTWKEHIQAINTHGLYVEDENGVKNYPLPALTKSADLEYQDLVLIFVKSHSTVAAAQSAANLIGNHTKIMTLQNGLGNIEAISGVIGTAPIIAGTTSHGATVLGPGRIRHAGKGDIIVGAGYGQNHQLESIADEFTRCGLETSITDDVDGLLWGKLLINVGINPLTALLGVTNGKLVEFESSRQLMHRLVQEGEQVAQALGVRLPYPDAYAKVQSVAVATGSNRSSMLQDIERGRLTEIDFINGAVLREGIKAGIPTPCNQTVTLLIKALQESGNRF